MRLAWTLEALDDRRSIYDHVEADSPRAALRLDELLRDQASRLVEMPRIGRPGRIAGTRELVAHRNYVIVYDIESDMVRVLRVLHAARMWPPADDHHQSR